MSSPCDNCGSDIRVCNECDLYLGRLIEIPKNATKGDIIKSLFNERIYEQNEVCTYYGSMRFTTDWWNSLFKESEK